MRGDAFLQQSNNDFDWLGPGIYFWENDPHRARSFAGEQKKRGKLKRPFVIGAVLTLGNCIDTLNQRSLEAIADAHASLVRELAAVKGSLPKNAGGKDLLQRNLDCAVIRTLHGLLKEEGQSADTLRGLYHEGGMLYEDGGFYKKSHIQIAVRNPACILGVFRLTEGMQLPLE
ncbi:hypothetical protein [Pseudochelatococcus contaminans]|uniref:Uncharacterized protein n=1 Tax=Pseudochelatococcus contaminans TaxID=1538103 RepID=A0A7W5Z6Q7_9HYPH|nr:hypothetical protein [Pseudochelatococcus contaminans]MBB3810707.1 hypothetical protein [Pseudochelatococcus contaminans]